MNDKIELYQGPERKFFKTMPFMPIIRESLEKQIGMNISQAHIQVTVLNVPEDMIINGTPQVDNLIPEFGYTYVMVYMDNRIVYRHPHPLSDIFTQTLQTKLRNQYPEITQWWFRFDVPGMPKESSMRATPRVEGSVPVRPYGPNEKPGFTIRRVVEPDPPVKILKDFGVTPDDRHRDAMVKVLLPPSLQRDLCSLRPLSDMVEEGGFLIGKVYRDGEAEGTYLLEVSTAPQAEYTGASFFHFTFTGDSFAGIKRMLNQDLPGERILGWFHTHLFPATVEMGLTSIDLTLHFGTFTIPWQVAGLINLDNNQRTLRFYVRSGSTMALCPYRVIDERH